MLASTSARAPVNRFPEDVDQFRLERRRETGERKRELARGRGRALSPSRRAREPSSLYPPSASSSPPTLFFLLLPPSLSVVLHLSRAPPVSLLFRVAEKMRPSGRTLVASVAPRCHLSFSLSLSYFFSFRISFTTHPRSALVCLLSFAIEEIPHFFAKDT